MRDARLWDLASEVVAAALASLAGGAAVSVVPVNTPQCYSHPVSSVADDLAVTSRAVVGPLMFNSAKLAASLLSF